MIYIFTEDIDYCVLLQEGKILNSSILKNYKVFNPSNFIYIDKFILIVDVISNNEFLLTYKSKIMSFLSFNYHIIKNEAGVFELIDNDMMIDIESKSIIINNIKYIIKKSKLIRCESLEFSFLLDRKLIYNEKAKNRSILKVKY